jgi:hopene-associated glycosyltransferase HpnB
VTNPAAILAATTAFLWLYLFFLRGQFWLLRNFDDDQTNLPLPRTLPKIQAIVPARNEAQTIAVTVRSLLEQNYPGAFSITVIDDHSTDHTAQIATEAAAEPRRRAHPGSAPSAAVTAKSTVATVGTANVGYAPSHPFSTLSAATLGPGWTGKLWALNEAVSKTLATNEIPPDYFWFTDADITHAPDTLHRIIARAEAENLDLVSLMVLLKSETIPEKLLIPPFLYFFVQLYPPGWIAKTKARTAGAAGGCLLMRTTALEKIGGLASVRNAMIDDCAIAAAVKKSGGRLWMGVTRRSLSMRSYTSFAEIRDMIARTAYTQLQYSRTLLALTVFGLFVAYVLPVGLLFHPAWQVRVAAAFATALMFATFLPTTGFYRQSAFWALTLPAAAVFYGYATALSAVRYWRGQGGQWKGRAQARKETSQ